MGNSVGYPQQWLRQVGFDKGTIQQDIEHFQALQSGTQSSVPTTAALGTGFGPIALLLSVVLGAVGGAMITMAAQQHNQRNRNAATTAATATSTPLISEEASA